MALGAAPLFALLASLAAVLLDHLEKRQYISKRQHAALRRRLGLSDDYPSPWTQERGPPRPPRTTSSFAGPAFASRAAPSVSASRSSSEISGHRARTNAPNRSRSRSSVSNKRPTIFPVVAASGSGRSSSSPSFRRVSGFAPGPPPCSGATERWSAGKERETRHPTRLVERTFAPPTCGFHEKSPWARGDLNPHTSGEAAWG
jgi:hypothetical protein